MALESVDAAMSLIAVFLIFELFKNVSAAENAFSFVKHYEKLMPKDIKVMSPLKHGEIATMVKNIPQRNRRDSQFKHLFNMYSPVMVKSLSFNAFGREFLIYLHKDTKIIDKDLILVEVDDKISRNVERPSGLDFYVGYVHGEPSTAKSHVYWEDEFMFATINTRNETYFIEPAKRYTPSMHDVMIAYRLSDMKEELVDSVDFCRMVYAPKLRKVNRANSRTKHDTSSRRTKRHAYPHEKACTLVIVADVNYFVNVGEGSYMKTTKSLIAMFSRINAIYLGTKFKNFTNYGLLVKKIVIHKSDAGKTYSYNEFGRQWTAYSLLLEFSKRVLGDFCLAHLVTFSSLDDALGLAYVGRTGERGGVCSGCLIERKTGTFCMNTGISSQLFSGNMLPSAQADLVVAHGHGFGSVHDSEICVPSKVQGGKYLMYSRTNSGKDPNNRKFSPCSIETVRYTLSTNAECFLELEADYCGNGVVEQGEQCDSGITIGIADPCCTAECKLAKGAECSPANSLCCSKRCGAAKLGVECRSANPMKCLKQSVCDGVSFECEDEEHVEDGTSCLNGGTCSNGTCHSLCEVDNLKECTCSNEGEPCVLCCKGSNGICSPFHKKIILADGSQCDDGLCSEGICSTAMESQMKTIRAWEVITEEYFSSIRKFLKDNVILVILVATIIPYLFASFYICKMDYYSVVEENELREWYSTKSNELFWKNSKVVVKVVPGVKVFRRDEVLS